MINAKEKEGRNSSTVQLYIQPRDICRSQILLG